MRKQSRCPERLNLVKLVPYLTSRPFNLIYFLLQDAKSMTTTKNNAKKAPSATKRVSGKLFVWF